MDKVPESKRTVAMRRFLAGESPQAIYRSLGRSRRWFYKWLRRFQEHEPASLMDQSRRPKVSPGKVSQEVEDSVKMVRLELYNKGQFCGAQAVRWELEALGLKPPPSISTIARVIRRNELTHRRTGRYEPKGTSYPALKFEHPNQVHEADWVGPLYLRGPVRFYSLNNVDLASGRCAVEPSGGRDADSVLASFWAVWKRLGIPEHLQVDNEMGFYGSPTHPRGLGPLLRLCLHHNVQLWFIPQREPWRNGVVEKFNDLYRRRFLERVDIKGWKALGEESLKFEARHNSTWRYSKLRGKTPLQFLDAAKVRFRFPPDGTPPKHPQERPTKGKFHLVRFIRSDGLLDVFGERFRVPTKFQYEYVVATVDVKDQTLRLFHDHQLVKEMDYKLR